MKTMTLRVGLSLMVALGFWASRLPAQTVVTMTTGEQILVVPTIPYEPALVYPNPSPIGPRMPIGTGPGLHRILNQHGMACQSNWPWGTCGSFHYDFNFIFGSCRWFNNESCYPNAYVGDSHGRQSRPGVNGPSCER